MKTMLAVGMMFALCACFSMSDYYGCASATNCDYGPDGGTGGSSSSGWNGGGSSSSSSSSSTGGGSSSSSSSSSSGSSGSPSCTETSLTGAPILHVIDDRLFADDNGTQNMDPQGNGGLRIKLGNHGASTASGTTADLYPIDSGVTLSGATGLRFGDIAVNDLGKCGVVGGGADPAGTCATRRSSFPIASFGQGSAGRMYRLLLATHDQTGNRQCITIDFIAN